MINKYYTKTIVNLYVLLIMTSILLSGCMGNSESNNVKEDQRKKTAIIELDALIKSTFQPILIEYTTKMDYYHQNNISINNHKIRLEDEKLSLEKKTEYENSIQLIKKNNDLNFEKAIILDKELDLLIDSLKVLVISTRDQELKEDLISFHKLFIEQSYMLSDTIKYGSDEDHEKSIGIMRESYMAFSKMSYKVKEIKKRVY